MRWYRGPQPDDEKPIGGGEYNKTDVGNEAFNFLPLGKKMLGYFQPQLQPADRRKAHPSSIHLEKIQPGVKGNALNNVLVVFVARNPISGGQYIVGWYPDATVHRLVRDSSAEERNKFGYFVETAKDNAVLLQQIVGHFPSPVARVGSGRRTSAISSRAADRESKLTGLLKLSVMFPHISTRTQHSIR
jgi:hypothetical protein